MAEKLSHEALAETHDLGIALAMGVKVRAALGTADGKPRQSVLVNLLKGEELQDVEVDTGMEAQAPLVRPDGAVQLHAIAAVDLDFTLVISPGHTELNDALRLHHALQDLVLLVFRMLIQERFHGFQHFSDRGEELLLVRVTLFYLREHPFDICFAVCHIFRSFINNGK